MLDGHKLKNSILTKKENYFLVQGQQIHMTLQKVVCLHTENVNES